MISIAQYGQAEFVDGTLVPVCLTTVDTWWPIGFYAFSITVFFVLPLGILIVLYTVIAKHLMDNPGLTSHGQRSNVLRYRKQVILMLGAVVASFFLCLAPFRALTVWIMAVPAESIMALGIDGYYSLLYFCRIMLYLNSAMNPILYNLMSSKFREGFLRLLRCRSPAGAGKKKKHKRAGQGPGTSGASDRGTGTFRTASTNMSSSLSGSGTGAKQRSRNGHNHSSVTLGRYRSAASTGGETSDSDVPERETSSSSAAAASSASALRTSVLAATIVRNQQQFADIVEGAVEAAADEAAADEAAADEVATTPDDVEQTDEATDAGATIQRRTPGRRRPSATYILQYVKSMQPTQRNGGSMRRKSSLVAATELDEPGSSKPESNEENGDDDGGDDGGEPEISADEDADERKALDADAGDIEVANVQAATTDEDDDGDEGDGDDDNDNNIGAVDVVDDDELCCRFLKAGQWNFESLV